MSEENAELVHRFYERLNAGDIEGVIQLCDGFYRERSDALEAAGLSE